ncbi:hypothetical protein SADUNF_Sadunf12G0072000 [Salix dunnii]|uniref:Uncharacterized protein n=1 Tax=Salix dunnii TaxID=1413687 RepID=A0A835JNC5_9ROSI|nr:hypothetical protein SADUNF_Sadunf12G0072000 [Salix dunnii]
MEPSIAGQTIRNDLFSERPPSHFLNHGPYHVYNFVLFASPPLSRTLGDRSKLPRSHSVSSKVNMDRIQGHLASRRSDCRVSSIKEKKSLDKEINSAMKKRQQQTQQEQHKGRENCNYQQYNHYQLHMQKQIQCNKGKTCKFKRSSSILEEDGASSAILLLACIACTPSY